MQLHCGAMNIELILTLNTEEDVELNVRLFSFPIRIIKNAVPKGFGANHNQAFWVASGRYFCVVNPDIQFDACPFLGLIAGLTDTAAGVAAPLVFGVDGNIEDSARHFPSPTRIWKKLFGKPLQPDYVFQINVQAVDWAGGMFMMFARPVFEQLNGFDARYFLYYEDVDICARLGLLDRQVVVCPQVRVTHHAQRSSHRHLKYLVWHLRSMSRFFLSPVYRQLKQLKRI
jgi:GT2 family glycosyltransferase